MITKYSPVTRTCGLVLNFVILFEENGAGNNAIVDITGIIQRENGINYIHR